MRWRARGLLLLCAMGAMSLACGKSSAPPDVILITIDTLRADHVGSYGYEAAQTPTLDALAARGVRFAQATSPTPITLPSHATIFTGRLPAEHGVRNNNTYRLPEGIPTLAEQYAANGYQTGAVVASMPLSARFGMDRGFAHYDDEFDENERRGIHFAQRPADEVRAAAEAWLQQQDSEEPLFLWVHFFDPHLPYEPPSPFAEQFEPALYDGEVAFADQQLGLLLEAMDALRSRPRVVAVTSDHGEGLGEHQEPSHALFLYQTTLHVPLILAGHGVPGGKVVETPVGLEGLAPTLLELSHLDATTLGSSTPWNLDRVAPGRQFSETLYPLEVYRWSPSFALRQGSRKVIRSAKPRAYDLSVDPGERSNLMEGEALRPWMERMLTSLDSMVAAQSSVAHALDATRQPTPEETEALAALGYAGGVPAGNLVRDDDRLLRATRDYPDASDRVDEFLATDRASALVGAQQYAAAVAVLSPVVEKSPDNVWARMLLAQALGSSGNAPQAIAHYEHAANLRPEWLEVQLNLARLQRRIGDVAQAAKHYERSIEIDPTSLPVLIESVGYLQEARQFDRAVNLLRARMDGNWSDADREQIAGALARLYLQLNRLDEGRDYLRASGAAPTTRVLEALYLQREGKWAEAATLLSDEALADHGEAQQYLGFSQQVLGQVDQAQQTYERSLQFDQKLHLSHNNLAWILATERGEALRALDHAEKALALNPGEVEYHDTYLEVLERLGRNDLALTHLVGIQNEFPGHTGLAAREEKYRQ